MQSGQGGNSGRSPTHNRGRILEWLRFQTGVAQRVYNANHVRIITQHLLTARIHRIYRTGHEGSLTQLIAILNDRGLQRHRHRQTRNIRGVLRTVRVAHPAHNRRQIIRQSIAAIITQILLTQKIIRGTMQRRRQRMRNRVPQHVGTAKIRGLAIRFSLHRLSFALTLGIVLNAGGLGLAGLRTRTPRTRVHGRTLPILRDKPTFGYSKGGHLPHSRGGGTRLSKEPSRRNYRIVATG